MKTLLESIKHKDAVNASSLIETLLKTKTLTAINEARMQVAADAFGPADLDEEELDEEQLEERRVIEKKSGNNAFAKTGEVALTPRVHKGWQSVRHKGQRFQVHGGIRNNEFINVDHPIKSTKNKFRVAK